MVAENILPMPVGNGLQMNGSRIVLCLIVRRATRKLARKHFPHGRLTFIRSEKSFGTRQEGHFTSFHGIGQPDFRQKSSGP